MVEITKTFMSSVYTQKYQKQKEDSQVASAFLRFWDIRV